MRRGKLDLVSKSQKSLLKLPRVTRNNTSTRNSSPTSNEHSSLSLLSTTADIKKLRSKKPHSQSPSSQPVIKIFLILALVCVFALKPASASWANSSFDRCMNITITNSGSETLTNFPAYINLTYDSDMQPDFLDIRFYSAGCNNGGTALDYEIENYTTSTNAHTWTRIQSLQSTGTTLSVYYKNNTAVTSGANPAGVWDQYYTGGWHM